MQDLSLQFFKFRNPHKPVGTVSTVFFSNNNNNAQIFTSWYMIKCANTGLPCSQTLYFLFKVRRARETKNRGGFIDRQHKGVGVGEEENGRSVDIFGSN